MCSKISSVMIVDRDSGEAPPPPPSVFSKFKNADVSNKEIMRMRDPDDIPPNLKQRIAYSCTYIPVAYESSYRNVHVSINEVACYRPPRDVTLMVAPRTPSTRGPWHHPPGPPLLNAGGMVLCTNKCKAFAGRIQLNERIATLASPFRNHFGNATVWMNSATFSRIVCMCQKKEKEENQTLAEIVITPGWFGFLR